ncbi:MAG: DUF2812 domain-containing protein [Lachnospiraceae bacterium]|nr:DUF2812 domain-containing protein [Lachnospiraceae bacterium]
MSLLTKKQYRLAPCPYYDVATMEHWLEEEARQGHLLSEDGFFFGVAVFETCAPCQVRYRLEPKEVLDWSAESLFPDQEARELCEEYGWKYIADRGKFFIYRSETAAARELNTDPKIQAMALKPMWEHERYNLSSSLFWIVAYPLVRYLLGKQSFMRMCIGMGTWLFAMGLAIGVWMLIRSSARLAHIARMRRRLAAGESLQAYNMDGQSLQKRRRAYWLGNLSLGLLVVIWVCCVFQGCAQDLENANQIPLENYVAEYRREYGQKYGIEPVRIFPFADMSELVERSWEYNEETGTDPSASSDPTENASFPFTFFESGMYPGKMNYVEAKRDLLASTVIQLNQNGSVTLPDGREFEGILYVDYYDTTMPWVAQVLYWEYVKEGQHNKHYKEIDLPELPVDEAICFMAYLPTLVLRKGDVLMVVELTQFVHDASDYELEPAQWARIFAESMG